MTIQHVSFTVAVNVGGKHTAITNWSRNTHGAELDISEKGQWIILKSKEALGVVFRTPISNVAYIKEVEDPEPAKVGK